MKMIRTLYILAVASAIVLAFLGCPAPAGPTPQPTPGDTTAPTISSTVPADGAAAVDNDGITTLVLTFSESVTIGTGTISIYKTADDGLFESIPVTAMSGSGTTSITATFQKTFLGLTGYYVTISASLFKDAASNNFAGITGKTAWDFATVADNSAPAQSLTASSPAAGAADVPNSIPFLDLSFNEDTTVNLAAGNIVIYDDANNPIATISPADLIGSGTKSIIVPFPQGLIAGMTYYIQYPVGLFQDAALNDAPGVLDTTTWTFTAIADLVDPALQSTSPVDGATDVSVLTSSLTMTFSEYVKLNAGSVTIYRMSDDSVFETIPSGSISKNQGTVTIPITNTFIGNVEYYVWVSSGLISDKVDNGYDGIADKTTWNFTAFLDTFPPVINSTTPADNATGVSAATSSLTIVFNEIVNVNVPTGGDITINNAAGGVFESIPAANLGGTGTTTITVPFIGSLLEARGYYVEIPANLIYDTGGTPNYFAGISGATAWDFTILPDTTPPAITTTSPADNAATVPLATSSLTLNFNDNVTVNASGGSIVIYNAVDDSVFATILATDLTGSGTSSINAPFTGPLLEGRGYYVNVPSNLFSDSAYTPNWFAGISSKTGWNFTALPDTTAPALTSTSPADNATGVPLATSSLTLDFNDNVTVNTSGGSIVIYKAVDDSVFATILATALTGSGTSSINAPFAGSLLEGDGYYVNIPSDLFRDSAYTPNWYAGISSKTGWNFTMEDVNPPVISSTSPADETTGVPPTTSSLSITFNEAAYVDSGSVVIKTGVATFATIPAASLTGSGTTTITIPFSGALAELTVYYVQFPGTLFRDDFNNYHAGIADTTTWNFTTGPDTTAPTLVSTTPTDDATGVLVSAKTLTVVFSENIAKGAAGNIVVYKNGVLFETVAVTSASVTVATNTATIVLTKSAFRSASSYYVQIDAGAFRDTAVTPNNYAGIADSTTWNFSTETGYVLTDSFDYGSTAGSLTSVSGGAWTELTAGTPNVSYAISGMTVAPESSGGMATGQKNLTSPWGQIVREALPSTVTSGVIYMAVTIQKTATTNTETGFGIALLNSANTIVTGLYCAGGSPANRNTVYLSTGANIGNRNNASVWVLKYNFATQVLSGFMNPTLTGAEPAADATASVTVTEMAAISIDQQWNAVAGSAAIPYNVDEIRISKYWSDLQFK